MKRISKLLFVVATTACGLLFATGSAQAQVTSTGTNQGIVDLTLQGTIQSALVLAINGTGATVITAMASNVMPTVSTATVDFGTFSTAQATALTNGLLVRTTAGTAGAFAVAQLSAMATYNANAGGPNAANIKLTLGATGGTSPIAAGNTRVQRTLPADWTNSVNGATISGTDTSICPNGNATTGNCASGTAIGHELALFIPDSQAAGTFTQVVRYTATAY
jgi:hypothetical protein